MRRIKKKTYKLLFLMVVLCLFVVKLIVKPDMGTAPAPGDDAQAGVLADAESAVGDAGPGTPELPASATIEEETYDEDASEGNGGQAEDEDAHPLPVAGREGVHPIYSVPDYKNTFPDDNNVQLASARRLGVKPVRDREDAEARKRELVYVGSNPFFSVARLDSSIPYLVPHASAILQEIGRNFFDSLMVKGIPIHQLVVSSVLRSQVDVQRLLRFNPNAKTNSAHLYGTTFDISYKRFNAVSPPGGPQRRTVSNDTLKWVLSEVLRDMRQKQRCYVRYEVKQSCFHITVR